MDKQTEDYYTRKVIDGVFKYRVFLMGLATNTLKGLTQQEVMAIVKRAFTQIADDETFWTRKR